MPHFRREIHSSLPIKSGLRSREEELAGALAQLFNTSGPALLEVTIPPDENVYPMVPGGKRLDEMVLGGE